MLELTGTAFSGDRPGLDLVVVVDVSGSMHGKKMNQLKTAMRFLVSKLSLMDQLSIVTFSNAATKLCPLQQITKASQRELQMLINSLKPCGDYTKIMDGLRSGLKILADRKVSGGRVAAVMLMCDGTRDDAQGAMQVGVSNNLPIYTFGFGMHSDPRVLSTIAANSMGGTFSHVPDIGGSGLTKAFSQCLAGLLTVAVQDLELTVAPAGDESTIVKVTCGNYPQTRNGDSLTVSFGHLYSREVRNVIVDLRFATVDSERSTEMLRVTYSYNSSSSRRQQLFAPHEMLTVWRTSVEVLHTSYTTAELQREEARLRTRRMINEAITMADGEDVLAAQCKLVEAQSMLDEQSNPLLRAELQKLLEHFQTSDEYLWRGSMYAFSSCSSHDRQRFTARGHDAETMRLFATQRMDEYLEQAKKFHMDPTKPLPSVDDDVEEEVAALLINVASREEEMRRLGLDTEESVRLFATPRMDTYLEQARVFNEEPTMPLPSVNEDGNKLLVAQNSLECVMEQSNLLLRTELQEPPKPEEANKEQGRAYALASETLHGRQRFPSRGGREESLRLFSTPRMDAYLELARVFDKDDEDVKEEVVSLIDVVASEE
ncbi:hypothetical protein CFC21_020745 [Triticum aestivum]|uniref:VWFA domain-containing protein n=2 Tax=Triticum aestivum TaxID=4565 RepID=A0A9R1J646_WHEAT|nr:E3 ubiquitin-protein ligase WAV3-like [Triticum aestivum]KAF7005636.1 hypothetical protein CFC21_020745 [Triticum aestivum]